MDSQTSRRLMASYSTALGLVFRYCVVYLHLFDFFFS